MQNFEATALQYLHDVLGITTQEPKPWAKADELPYFLQNAFRLSELVLLGQPVVLAVQQSEQTQSLSELRKRLDKVKTIAACPVLYGVDALASYERKRLIEKRVPFIVPNNQLYLPDLGLDLREYFRQRAAKVEGALSPSTQALLIAALLRQPWQVEWQPSMLGSALGYTAMTVSRAAKELSAAGLATPYYVGRSRWLRMESSAQQTWERAKPLLRTPVRRTVWISGNAGVVAPLRLAGFSALSRYSMLTEPTLPVLAIGPADWKAATTTGVRELPEPMPGASELQLWAYNPALVPDQPAVDPLSLILSMQDNTDDRVQIALDELKELLPW